MSLYVLIENAPDGSLQAWGDRGWKRVRMTRNLDAATRIWKESFVPGVGTSPDGFFFIESVPELNDGAIHTLKYATGAHSFEYQEQSIFAMSAQNTPIQCVIRRSVSWSLAASPYIEEESGNEGKRKELSEKKVAQDIVSMLADYVLGETLEALGEKIATAGLISKNPYLIAAGSLTKYSPQIWDFIKNYILPLISFSEEPIEQIGDNITWSAGDYYAAHYPSDSSDQGGSGGPMDVAEDPKKKELIEYDIHTLHRWCAMFAPDGSGSFSQAKIDQMSAFLQMANDMIKTLAAMSPETAANTEFADVYDRSSPGAVILNFAEGSPFLKIIERICHGLEAKYRREIIEMTISVDATIVNDPLNVKLQDFDMDLDITNSLITAGNEFFKDRFGPEVNIEDEDKRANLAERTGYPIVRDVSYQVLDEE